VESELPARYTNPSRDAHDGVSSNPMSKSRGAFWMVRALLAIEKSFPVMIGLWWIGMFLLAARHLFGWVGLGYVRRQGTVMTVGGDWQATLRILCRRETQNCSGGRFTWKPHWSHPVETLRIEADGYVPKVLPRWVNREGRIAVHCELQPGRTLVALLIDTAGHPVDGKEVFVCSASRPARFCEPKSALRSVITHSKPAEGGMFWSFNRTSRIRPVLCIRPALRDFTDGAKSTKELEIPVL